MSATPGWYPDPAQPGTARYFDGLQWTSHTQPHPLTIQQVNQVASVPVQPIHQSPGAAVGPPHMAPPVQHVQHVQHVQVNQVAVAPQPKSVAVALVLTFFFGPLGMLYSTVAGGLIMLGLNLVLGTLTLGLFFLISWPIQMVWAAMAAQKANEAVHSSGVQFQQLPTAGTGVAAPYPQHPHSAGSPTHNWTPQPAELPPAQPAPTGAQPEVPHSMDQPPRW
jgi:hypothetical protein